MGTRYKRFYITGALSILGIFALIAPFIENYYDYEDVTCGTECWTTFCMKNSNKNLYFYNKQELPLTFDPVQSVHSVEFFKKDRRFKTGYRPIDFITPYTKNRLYVFKIPAYSVTCYGIKITKDSAATVKWTFAGLDPTFFGVSANLTFNLSALLDDPNNVSQNFAPNWSRVLDLVNFSDNFTQVIGNFSWNFTEFNISTATPVPWVYNFTNTGNTNFTLSALLNKTSTVVDVFIGNDTFRVNLSTTTFKDIVNITVNETKLFNVTIDLINISQEYDNWTLVKNTAEWGFNITFNVTLLPD